MITVDYSVVINRPIEEVFTFVTNPENNVQWVSGLLETKQVSQGPIGVGSTGTDVRQFLGQRIESAWEITEYEQNRKVGFKTTSGPIPLEATYTYDAAEGGTRVSFVIQGEVSGFFKMAESILAGMVRRQIEADHNNLKDLLEAQT